MNEDTALLIRRVWFRNGAVLLAEFILLGISYWAAFAPLGGYNTAINVVIAAFMALIGLLFLWAFSGKTRSCGLRRRAEFSG